MKLKIIKLTELPGRPEDPGGPSRPISPYMSLNILFMDSFIG